MRLSEGLNPLALLLLTNIPFISANWLVDDDGCRTPNGGVGNCMGIRSCWPMVDFLMKTHSIDESTRKYLKGFQCGYDGTGPKVCCPSSPIKFYRGSTTTTVIFKPTPPSLRKSTGPPRKPNYDCKTKTQDVGRCVPLESCDHVTAIISKIQESYNTQNSKGRDFFLRTDRPNTPRKVWCEYVGEAGGNVGRDTCVSAEGFSDVLEEYRELDLRAALESYQCGEGRACCPFTPADPQYHPNLNLLESDCAVETLVPYKPRRRLLSFAENATLLQYPWMATLKYSGSRTREYQCAATLISKRYLLTAAHCVRPTRLKLVGARLGEFDLNENVDCQGSVCASEVQDFEVTEEDAVIHPDYDTVTYHDDIALIRLRKDVEFSSAVQQICLPIKFVARVNNFENRVIVTGWGMTEKGSPSSTLLEIKIPVVSTENCYEYYPKSINITDKQFCAGGAGQDSCKGDSGGPLMDVMPLNTIFGRSVVQYGIVSFGLRQECGARTSPGVYTRITSYLNWILDNLKP